MGCSLYSIYYDYIHASENITKYLHMRKFRTNKKKGLKRG